MTEAARQRRTPNEIVLRVMSALILAPAGLWVAHAGGLPLILATAACGAVASAEWVGMANRDRAGLDRWAMHVVAAASSIAAVSLVVHRPDWSLAAALAGAMAAALIAVTTRRSATMPAFGVLYTSLPFAAFVWLRESTPEGQGHLLALLAIVWTTDIAAYFAGRGFGGPLLSPSDSPNKTWTGAAGALLCAGLAGGAVARAAGGDFVHWVAASLIVSFVAQCGDLLESRFKRHFGVKDTSGLIPGHGGILDRLDALMASTLFVTLIVAFAPSLAPGFGRTGG